MSGRRTSTEHPVNVYYGYHSIGEFKRSRRMEGPFRVVVFCILALVVPCMLLGLPLYIRYEFFKDVSYHLGESDLVTVDQRISNIWCSEQELRMNGTFHAYLLNQQPQISEDLKHIEMQKHLQLADDQLEYWGFFLLTGSRVTLSVCSRYDGARLMVLKGAKNLKHCALIDPSKNNDEIDPWEEDVSAPQGEKIKVTFQQGEVQTLHPHKKHKSVSKSSAHNESLPQLDLALDPSIAEVKSISLGSANFSKQVSRPLGNSTVPEQGTLQSLKLKSKNGGSRRRRFITTEDDTYDEEGEAKGGAAEDAGEDEAPAPVGGPDAQESLDDKNIRSSGSSFAKNLWTCYGGDTLFTQTFSASPLCQTKEALMKYVRMKMVHEVTSTGYYYYIFYSDNDILSNDIFALFNIEKVEYSFPNYTHSCLNTTHCELPLTFFSSEKVLVEVPLQDGVSDEDALSQIVLISTCKPRLSVYLIFPIAIILVIMSFAFI